MSWNEYFYYSVKVPGSDTGIPCYRSVKAEGCPMPDGYLNGRPVYFGDIAFGDDSDEPGYFEEACYADTDADLSDAELEQLSEQEQGYIAEQWYEHQVARAEAYADMER